jgi:hypothetical protein
MPIFSSSNWSLVHALLVATLVVFMLYDLFLMVGLSDGARVMFLIGIDSNMRVV